MNLIKNVFGTLEVDLDRGVIWVNSLGRCVLRICQLKFQNKRENFSSIDCTGQNAILIGDCPDSSSIMKFLQDSTENIYLADLQSDEKFLSEILELINEKIKERKK